MVLNQSVTQISSSICPLQEAVPVTPSPGLTASLSSHDTVPIINSTYDIST